MPIFPSSGYSASPANGVFVRNQGGPAPIVEADEQPSQEFLYPFKVTVKKDGENFKVTVRAGTVNNLVPKIGSNFLDAETPPTLTLTGDDTHRIYLKASSASPPVFFPDTVVVESATTDQSDTNANGYLKIASVVVSGGNVTAVNQFVYASQVLVRAKPGTANALWSWSSR
ncbi:MAG: hypothetical protein ACK5VI_09725 [Opitutia bacterium]